MWWLILLKPTTIKGQVVVFLKVNFEFNSDLKKIAESLVYLWMSQVFRKVEEVALYPQDRSLTDWLTLYKAAQCSASHLKQGGGDCWHQPVLIKKNTAPRNKSAAESKLIDQLPVRESGWVKGAKSCARITIITEMKMKNQNQKQATVLIPGGQLGGVFAF